MSQSNSLRNKVILLSAVVGVITVGICGVGLWAVDKIRYSLSQNVLVSDSIKTHMQADMMHDAIRGDVLNALLTSRNLEDMSSVQNELSEHVAELKKSIADNSSRPLPPEIKATLVEITPQVEAYTDLAERTVRAARSNYDAGYAAEPAFMKQFSVVEDLMGKASNQMQSWSNSQVSDGSFASVVVPIMTALLAVMLLAMSVIPLMLVKLVFRPLKSSAESMQTIAKGDYTAQVEGADRADEMGEMAKAMEQLKSTLDTNTRVKQALDSVTSNVMMADENHNIIYLNESVMNMLKEAEKDIQKDLPNFRVSNLMGANIDIFHKNPSHQRGMLERMTSKTDTSIVVGGRSFNLSTSPLFDQNKKRIGTVVEWLDGAAAGMVDAINKSQAVIEFLPDGTIINANQNFLSVMGYALSEIQGRHHHIFIEAAYRSTAEYRQFWEALNRGEANAGEFKRIGKDGREVWINATYNPIMDLKGKVVRVVKTATDISEMVRNRMENEMGMNEAVRVLTAISAGDLTQKMQQEYQGTFSQIKQAVNSTVDQLYDMVRKIIDSSQAVNSAASEIASGSADLSSRTEQQASSLEETAASMEEITGTVRQNTENTRNASSLSSETRELAESGGKVVNDAVEAMTSIEKSSQKIADIIGVIDEIAFQTNLLALNAAVEAARAGEAGKGFAVVASEVRSLAGRSASASKEIKTLINESGQQVKTGAELVNQAGSMLGDIVSSVRKVADIISEIATASTEQSTGINEISTAIAQMDETTQQNAALVEENTAAAQSLVQQANALEGMMRFFKISEAGNDAQDDASEGQIVSYPPARSSRPMSAVKPSGGRPSILDRRKIVASGAAVAKSADANWEEF